MKGQGYQLDGQAFRMGMAWVENMGHPNAGQRPAFLKVGGTDGVLVLNPGKVLVVLVAASKPRLSIERIGAALSRHLP